MRDDGAEAAVVLTLHPERVAMAALAPSDVAVFTCTVDDSSVLTIVGSGTVSIDSTGTVSPSGATAIRVRGVADLDQHLSRSAIVACTISTPSNARSHVYDPLTVTTLSVNQPSFKTVCPLAAGADPTTEVDMARCSTEGEFLLFTVDMLCESCSHFDLLSLTYLPERSDDKRQRNVRHYRW